MDRYAIDLPQDAIDNFCKKHRITEFALFGSVLRGDFGPDSDVDVLVTFEVGYVYTLFDLVDMQLELEKLIGRTVDLIDKQALLESSNYIRRRAILESAEVVHAR